ncbi:hypothetical protein BDY17DRAFT_325675 [Neohortaea acidophila]|uniref:NmrA-like domain-containing protein n=1 Tax=Neohortaea acidophila TaxID=245834 RepID=A0A6A6PRU4_9PEZI|nr:uncharacterized protein BDY17DRAFT_325675 [Neohortaea acidophila]KAF2482193.1 hypothetical protein BDY17DRAFT_325675 [Neohortaea acidophila]
MSTTKKTIAVVGATGNQGSSVARTFLALSNWNVRCLTRDPSKPIAKELASLGAEFITADLSDRSSLAKAFDSVHAIFLNTDFWQTWRPAKAAADAAGQGFEVASATAFEVETSQRKNVADAAAAVPTLERLIVSTLPSVEKASKGKYRRSMHSQAKAWVVDYIVDELPELAKKTSYIILGAYHDNALVLPREDPSSGKYVLALPFEKGHKMPIINAKQSTGRFVRALVEDEQAGKFLLAYDTYPTFEEVVKDWAKVNGKEVMYVKVSIDDIRTKSGLTDEHLEPLAAFAEGASYTAGIEGVVEPHHLVNKGE